MGGREKFRPPIDFLVIVIFIEVTLSLQGRRTEGIKYASCCVALIPCAPGTCRLKRALPGINFMPSASGEFKPREFLHFQGRLKKAYRGVRCEDNAENEEIIILRRVVPCKLRVFELFKIIKNNRRVPGFK